MRRRAAFAHPREWAYKTRAKGRSWSAMSSVCNFFLGRGMGPWRAEVNRCGAGEGEDGV